MRADRVRPRTYGIQGHEVTSNTHINHRLNHTGNEAPTLIPPWVKIVIWVAKRPLFTCVMRYHTSSPKGEGRNLVSSKSVAGAKLPDSRLSNPNVHKLLNTGHLQI